MADQLLEDFYEKELLLVLDNCEHLAGACAQLVSRLLQAPRIVILATSREPLSILGESSYPLQPFSVPAPSARPDELEQCEAVQLFVERAHILPGLLLRSNAAIIARICRRLDGCRSPLSWPARANVLTLEQMEARSPTVLLACITFRGPRGAPAPCGRHKLELRALLATAASSAAVITVCGRLRPGNGRGFLCARPACSGERA
jgi:hypothetical protein